MEGIGRYEFTAEGLSLEKLLNQCAGQGIKLYGVKKASPRKISGSVSVLHLPKLTELSESHGWKLTVGPAHGLIRLSIMAKKRALLSSGVLIFLILCWASLSCVWTIDIYGAGPYTGEVERILKEHSVSAGKFSFLININAIQHDLESQLTGLAWADANISGVRFTVHCVQAQLAKGSDATPGDIVALRDGVISSVAVYAGTPKVKVGDVVKRGQVLVRGEERGFGGAIRPIRAEAVISARIWYTASAKVGSTYYQTNPTGRSFTRQVLCTPFYEWPLDHIPQYDDFDMEKEISPIGGSLPIWLRVERYIEVKRHERKLEDTQMRREAELAAMRLAQEKVEPGVRVIDKWVEYSMINDGGCYATAVLEAIVDIATTLNMI